VIFVATTFIVFVLSFVAVPVLFVFCRLFGIYTIVHECHAKVYILFGDVLGVLDEPGLHLPVARFGLRACLVPFFGRVADVDLRLDQIYLRSQAVNTEEGTPMGIGVWYEMRVREAVAFLFENADPAGSLRANVSNATVRELSNLPLPDMLEDRHAMSRSVRKDVTPKAAAWGYEIGSVYIRKVHFRDHQMIDQIEQKVVNRLRQVTSAIRQAGENQVNVIQSTAEREAAVEFARAAAVRPQLVGEAFGAIAEDGEIVDALLRVLEVGKLMETNGEITLIPGGQNATLLRDLVTAKGS
jgi:regulator of protease activity HflC (stomatin/prohibitin superfamily)